MSREIHNKMHIFRKAFWVFMVLDIIELVSVGATLGSNFKMMAEYGALMFGVTSVITVGAMAVLLFQILAKRYLIRSTSAASVKSAEGKGCIIAVRLLILFNLAAAIIGVLALGGEGATVITEMRGYLQILASAAEVMVVFFYLRTVKKAF